MEGRLVSSSLFQPRLQSFLPLDLTCSILFLIKKEKSAFSWISLFYMRPEQRHILFCVTLGHSEFNILFLSATAECSHAGSNSACAKR